MSILPITNDGLDAWIVTQGTLGALVASRAFGLVTTAPGFAAHGLDYRYRLILGAMLGVLLWPLVKSSHADGNGDLSSVPSLGAACLIEWIVGGTLGWSAMLVIAGARQAGEIVGAQAGFSTSSFFDPETGDELGPLGQLYGLIALGVFLSLDGPIALVQALAESFDVVPIGFGGSTNVKNLAGSLSVEAAQAVFAKIGQALELTIKAAAPIALAMTLASLALGLIGKASPTLQGLASAMPVRALVGLLLIMLGIVTLEATMTTAWTSWAER